MKTTILTIMMAAASFSSQAQFVSGNTLLDSMNNSDVAHQAMVMGFILGARDATVGVSHCPPGDVTSGQMRDMVKRSLVEMSDLRHLPAVSFVTSTLKAKWPCVK